MWQGGRVVMQRPAKPCTSVRFRSLPPPLKHCIHWALDALSHQDRPYLQTYNSRHKMDLFGTTLAQIQETNDEAQEK